MSFRFFDKLSQDFTGLLDDKEDCNVIIEVDQNPNKKLFLAHSNVLRYRSSYFRAELVNTHKNEDNVKTLIEPHISFQIFDIILKYVYGGIVNLDDANARFIFELTVAANKFELDELTVKLEHLLVETKSSWMRTYFSDVHHSIYNTNNLKTLKKFCDDIIARYPALVFNTENFTTIQESTLVSLLERDDLQLEESKIWDYVIKWGIAQNPGLPSKREEWIDEDFETLKVTVRQCLPHVRYFQLPSEEILGKVGSYQKILDTQLWEDLKQHSVSPGQPVSSIVLPARIVTTPKLPNRIVVKEPFSTIITDEHAAEITSWIDRKGTASAYSPRSIPYNFQLILRGSRDGFHPQTFWNMCHSHANTVVVLKVAGTDEILGGYNPLAWDKKAKKRYIQTSNCFVFSLRNGNIPNSIISRIGDKEMALIYCDEIVQHKYGPYFGNCYLMMRTEASDFTKDKGSWCNGSSLFEMPIRTTSERFSITDYEVFKVVHRRT